MPPASRLLLLLLKSFGVWANPTNSLIIFFFYLLYYSRNTQQQKQWELVVNQVLILR